VDQLSALVKATDKRVPRRAAHLLDPSQLQFASPQVMSCIVCEKGIGNLVAIVIREFSFHAGINA